METRIDEVADNIYRLSTFVPEVNPPAGFAFNQFLIRGAEPLLFHLGHRRMFPLISAAVAKLVPLDRLRWIAGSHLEADEYGAMNEWLAAAPNGSLAHCPVGANVSLRDMADRPARVMRDDEAIDIGGKRVRFLATPHLPHGWDAQLVYEETTSTLFCSDLFSQSGDPPALTESDIVAPAIEGEQRSQSLSLTPTTAPTLRRLAALQPKRLALMHGPTFVGDGADPLSRLADHLAAQLHAAGQR